MNQIVVDTANAEKIAFDVQRDVLKPAEQVDYLAWAENNIVFSELESRTIPARTTGGCSDISTSRCGRSRPAISAASSRC